jgi:ATP-dependent DNA ligase
VRKNRIEQRRKALKQLVAQVGSIPAIKGEGALVFAKACEMDLEGIVSKRSLYRSGNAAVARSARTRRS